MKQLRTVPTSAHADFWKKKEIVSFLLSITVFFIHISSFAQYAHIEDNMSGINQILGKIVHDCFTKHAVPLYFIIAGALFFRDYDDKKYLDKIKKRIHTILIPYLIWNTVWMLFDIVTSYSFLSQYFIGRPKFVLSIGSVLEAILLHKSNGVFWFLFDLMFFILLSPVINLLIRNRYVGIAVIVALEVLSLFHIGLPENIFVSHTAIVYYLIGAIIGKHYFDGFCKKSSLSAQIISLVILLLCAVAFYFDLIVSKVLFHFTLILSAWAFWNFSDLFVYKLPSWKVFSNSFIVYAMHVNVSAVISKLIYLSLPKNGYMALPNFILTLPLTIIFIQFFSSAVNQISPRLYRIITGGR